MAVLRHVYSARVSVLEPEHLVGRSAMCSLQIVETYVSAWHAAFRWTGSLWEVKDLGSRNGTYVNGHSLRVGQPCTLARGDTISFGEPGQDWQLANDEAPRPMVIPLGPGSPLILDGDVHALPSAEDPEATVFRGSDGLWRIERRSDMTVPLEDQTRFEIGGRAFRFTCPVFGSHTATSEQLELRAAHLVLGAARDGGRAHLRVETPDTVYDLGARPHHDVLLALAQHRLADIQRAVPDSSAGWAYEDDVGRELGIPSLQIHVDVFRLRKEIASLGILDPADVVERRPRTGQLRLGVRSFEVEDA